ncbi:phosphoribosyltransferase [Rubrivivax sp. RP6-9]|uniref:phosphoribosyltransferase n=1 Tax=Rubrivivax sp. RP6-9 TaxID=3415750 RepID=UPI003CC54A4F
MVLPFADRTDAGRLLGQRLLRERLPAPLVVVALPRGGVPVALEVARALQAPLDLVIVRKIGAPWQRELAVAAVADGEAPVVEVDEGTAAATGADRDYLDREADLAWREIGRRRAAYLRGRPAMDLAGKTAVLVDDGIATGSTARAALHALRRRHAAHLVLAVPVAAHESLMELRLLCDRIVCLAEPQPLRAVGQHYIDFHQVGDAEVIAALDAAPRAGAQAAA